MRLNQAKSFLKKKMQVRVTVLFWGKFRRKKDAKQDVIFREAEEKLERFAKLGKVSSPPKMSGSKYTMVIG
jgi:translation initiation factor IF-3